MEPSFEGLMCAYNLTCSGTDIALFDTKATDHTYFEGITFRNSAIATT